MSRYLPPWETEDVRQLALLGLWDAALTYDPGKGAPFTTWAVWRMRSHVRGHLRRRARDTAHAVSLEAPVQRNPDGDCATLGDSLPSPGSVHAEVEDREAVVLARRIAPLLAERVLDGYTQAEIGLSIGRSQPQASRLIAQQAAKLRRELEGQRAG